MTSHACRTACNELDRKIGNIKNMKDGNECYIAGNGKCRQNGKRGKNTLLVCMKKGNRNILQHVKVQTTFISLKFFKALQLFEYMVWSSFSFAC